ncbi:hypothetical protein Syun_022607 [Stephania yunnanensis]|uniref:Uncharacterized protein n=1 Tax=Stephania yunnanensis TaxID=152371 RepID=A0AAP0F7B6_9MAGN
MNPPSATSPLEPTRTFSNATRYSPLLFLFNGRATTTKPQSSSINLTKSHLLRRRSSSISEKSSSSSSSMAIVGSRQKPHDAPLLFASIDPPKSKVLAIAILSLRLLKIALDLVNAVLAVLVLPLEKRMRGISSSWRAVVMAALERPGGGGGGSGRGFVRLPWRSWRSESAERVEDEAAKRREIAIRRVLEDREDERSVRDFSLFLTSRGGTLFTQSWTPAAVEIK